MKALLKPSGGKYILEIDEKTLIALKIDPTRPIELTGSGQNLKLAGAESGEEERELDLLMDEVIKEHGETLRRLS